MVSVIYVYYGTFTASGWLTTNKVTQYQIHIEESHSFFIREILYEQWYLLQQAPLNTADRKQRFQEGLISSPVVRDCKYETYGLV